ncbi:MAG: hypothetical protein MEQ07_05210 [Aquimonas sp.]|nr:hypothetical protein [Aquimonas sp.]
MKLRSCAALSLVFAGVLPAASASASTACAESDPTFVLASPGAAARVPGGVVLPHEIYVACPEPDILLPLAAAQAAGAGIDAITPDRFDLGGNSVLVSFDRQVGGFRPADVLRCAVGSGSAGTSCTRVFDAAARGIPAHVNLVGVDQLGTREDPQLVVAFDQTFRLGEAVLRPQRMYTFAQNGSAGPGPVPPPYIASENGLDRATGLADISLVWNNRLAIVRDRWSRSSGGGGVPGPGRIGLQFNNTSEVFRVFDFAAVDPSWRASGVAGLGSQSHARATFEAGSVSVDETVGSVNLSVLRPVPPFTNVLLTAQGTIRYSVVLINGTAIAGQDYNAAPPQLVQFDHGNNTPQSVGFSVINNAIADGDRTFTVRMTPISAFAAPGEFMEVQITIVDDEGGGSTIFANGFE